MEKFYMSRFEGMFAVVPRWMVKPSAIVIIVLILTIGAPYVVFRALTRYETIGELYSGGIKYIIDIVHAEVIDDRK
jgi:hypothetical protein